MSPTTEIAILKLRDSTETLEGSSQATSTWREIISEILSSEGAQRLYWGKAVEDPSLVRLFIDWESLEHHKKVQASEPYAALIEKIMSIFSEVTLVAHSNLKDLQHTARDVFTSPAAELLTVFFPAEYTVAQQEKFEAGMHQFLKNIEGKAEGARAAAAGWGMESDIANLKILGLKGRAFFLFIGWDRVEDHLQFRGTDAYKDNIHFIRDAEDLRDFLNMHFHGKEMVKGLVLLDVIHGLRLSRSKSILYLLVSIRWYHIHALGALKNDVTDKAKSSSLLLCSGTPAKD